MLMVALMIDSDEIPTTEVAIRNLEEPLAGTPSPS